MSTYGLAAWTGHRQVGTLTYDDDTGLFAFVYAPDWVGQPGAFPISPAIPFDRPANLTPELHSARVRRFFENLLPERRALDDAAQAHAVPKANLYGLLCALGSESTGALSLLPEGVHLHEPGDGGHERFVPEVGSLSGRRVVTLKRGPKAGGG